MIKLLIPALVLAMRLSAGPLSAFLSPPAILAAAATDVANNLYIAGNTTQGNLPVTSGAFQTSFSPCPPSSGGFLCQHGFVAKFSSNGSLLLASRTLTEALPTAITVASSGDVFAVGSTSVAPAFQEPRAHFKPRIRAGSTPSSSISIQRSGATNHASSFPTTPGAVLVPPTDRR
jgi:hypothetical protein